ncbi:hypothetical protein Ahy_A10g048444 [Arachis hypogaea]|uniref:Helitron helicase-like domain-containing protein n=1 Tax=Arachis hypogaea TaxID=3818 RepID=A0A445B549_ARAHY|nr:hypothetical protein Ahy_A10g048444 [Arachis hypogaea]
MHDILNDVFTNFVDINDHVLFASSETKGYLDDGDCNYTCTWCGVGFWYDERVIRESKVSQPVFSICCLKEKVQLSLLKEPPELLVSLLSGNDPRSKHFFKNIRAYNNLFCFTSIGGRVDTSLSNGSSSPQFILCDKNYHRIGSLLPVPGQQLKFAQLYIFDTENELANREEIFCFSSRTDSLDSTLIEDLLKILDENNVVAKSFRMAKEFYQQRPTEVFSICLFRHRAADPRVYNEPTVSEIAALIIGDFDGSDTTRDIIIQLFELKIQSLMIDLKDGVFFGSVNAGMYTIEFQKRGLPHAHILVWLQNMGRLQTTEIMDEVISAELPDPVRFPKLYSVITKYMIHGPCGKLRHSSPCMRNGGCSKFYPKKFVDATAHINLEFCNKSNVIKYLFKYINKGRDRVTASIRNVQTQEHGGQDVDEIKQFYDCRYLAPCESAWRLFAFDIHHKWPSVQRLIFHLPGKHNILFTDHDKIPEIVEKNKYKDTMFTVWMGCKSFESIRIVDGDVYDSFKAACNALGLLSDDQEFINAIKETVELSSGFQLCQLFVTLLASNSMNKPELVWRDTWRLLADDILYYRRREL